MSLKLLIFLISAAPLCAGETKFVFRGFTGKETEIIFRGDASVQPDGLLRLTDRKPNIQGTAFYYKPVRLLENGNDSNVSTVGSFSASFIFSIISAASSNGGYGFTLSLSPTPYRTGAEAGQYLGYLSRDSDGSQSNHVFAAEFDTVQGFKDREDRTGNHVGLSFNSLKSDIQEPVVYYDKEDLNRKEEFSLQTGDPIRALLDYHGPSQMLSLTVYPAKLKSAPAKPLISLRVPQLSRIVQEEMYVGFTAATGDERTSAHYLMGWSFSSGGERPEADVLNLSELPRPPKKTGEKKRGFSSLIIALIVALSCVTVILIMLLIFFVIYKNCMRQGDILEDWEINHPHRLNYKDLYSATEGFKEENIIGVGGFGTVFRGRISPTEQIAVKKITPGSMQGIREFVAEIETLGRLSHRNLVQLRGWCKHKTHLLLAYDYMPHGSLDSLLHTVPKRCGSVLSWSVRFLVAKGVASGLLYLHEEWEQIVIHRDVKPSNVLIDEAMSPRLGDFGLARLYERGSEAHTTVVFGTQGYMAPELTRSGNYSSASDVFAFGVLLLEMVSGRIPTGPQDFFIADWVMELHESGDILRAVDPRLDSGYDVGEARLALAVGLLCCRQSPVSRPSMGMVIKYLNRDEVVPEVVDHSGSSRGGLEFSDKPWTSSVASLSISSAPATL